MKLLLLLLSTLCAQATTKTFTVTAYCPCQRCCALNAGGWTASGVKPLSGLTAAGPRWMRYGTKLQIPGVGFRVIEDRLARHYDARIDVYVRTHREAVRFGSRKLRVSFR